MTIDGSTYRRVMGAVPTGVSVLTIVNRNGTDHGMTVGAFCSLSLAPPLVLACIGDDATIAAEMRGATVFGISVLAEDQEGLSERFADREARGFEGIMHTRPEWGHPPPRRRGAYRVRHRRPARRRGPHDCCGRDHACDRH